MSGSQEKFTYTSIPSPQKKFYQDVTITINQTYNSLIKEVESKHKIWVKILTKGTRYCMVYNLNQTFCLMMSESLN